MRKLILAAGVAAFAIAAPAAAKPDKGGGGHGGNAQAQRGGGGGQQAQRGGGGGGRQMQMQRAERHGGGGGQRAFQMQRGGGGRQAQRMERRGGGERRQFAIEHRGGGERQMQRMERRGGSERFANFQSNRNERRAQRVARQNHGNRDFARIDNRGRNAVRVENRDRIGHDQRIAFDRGQIRGDRHELARVNAIDVARYHDDIRNHSEWHNWNDGDWDRHYAYRGIPAAYVGCPPGLAKKSPACVPPGLAKQHYIGQALPSFYASNYLPLGLRDIYHDNDDYYYRWGDGYVYRVDRGDNLISALLPLIGGGYGVGQQFPYYNQPSYYVPSYYQSFYPDTPYDYYRYDNGYVYRLDAGSGMIEDVIPLLDRGYGMGQMLPAGYSYYNVPYQYRDYYYDTPEYAYRYAPGAIYQVDRDSQLITAIASLLTGGLSVGQPLPASYSAYNVPFAYRDRYYDSPESWYRYSDGYIYQVDPTTRLITAMVQALV
jgi:hypothetical protein